MNAKHTTGQWYVKGTNPPMIYANSGLDIIAQCDSMNEMRKSQELANARLIAAAPELLAALEKAADMIAELQRRGCPAGPVSIPSLINDAIAKATGQSAD